MNEDIRKEVFSEDAGSQNMRDGFSVRRANQFFLCYTMLSLALGFGGIPGLPPSWASLLWQIPALVIALLFCRKDGIELKTAFGFRKVGVRTILLTVVICIAMHSVSHLVSSLTNLLFPSFLEMATGQLLGGSFLVNMIGVAVIPAFFEEFIIRGCMLNSYLGTGRIRASVLLSALLFGLMHMNATQLFYSFVMGIVLALLFTLTDSIWPGILFHFLNNGMAPIAEVLETRYGEEFVSRYMFPFSRGLSDPKSAAVTITAAAVGLVITVLCLRGIARHEGSEEKLSLFVRGGGGTKKLITPALIIAIVVSAAMTVAVTVAMDIKMKQS